MTRLALIGVGRWGSNIKRTLAALGVNVAVVEKGDALDPAASLFRDVQGMLIATPVNSNETVVLEKK